MHPFRAAAEAKDADAMAKLLADDVVFRSPAVHTPYHGREITATILRAVVEVFEDFRYVREIGSPDGADHVLVFRARVGDKQIEGSDILHQTPSGEIDELTVMIRPLNGLLAVAEAMRSRLSAG